MKINALKFVFVIAIVLWLTVNCDAQSIVVDTTIKKFKIIEHKDTKLHDVKSIEFRYKGRRIFLHPRKWYEIYKVKGGIVIKTINFIEEDDYKFVKI